MANYSREQAMAYSQKLGYTQSNVSKADWNLLDTDPDRFVSIINYKVDYSKAKTKAEKDAIHKQAEYLRQEAGYSGGADGSGYYKTGETPREFTYADAPSFAYSTEEDPLYQAYKKQYLREGQRATEDALGAAAAASGGIPSSYAATAAAQAGGYYAAQLADKVPELYNFAYSRYGDEVKQHNTDREFAYKQHMAGIENDDKLTARNTEAEDKAYQRTWDEAAQMAAAGDYSGYDKLGVDTAQNPIALDNAARQQEYNLEKAKIALNAGNYSEVERLLGFKVSGSDVNGKLLLQAALNYAKLGDYSLLNQLVRTWQ